MLPSGMEQFQKSDIARRSHYRCHEAYPLLQTWLSFVNCYDFLLPFFKVIELKQSNDYSQLLTTQIISIMAPINPEINWRRSGTLLRGFFPVKALSTSQNLLS